MGDVKAVKTWTKTKVQNLVRHKTGTYYARLYVGGKEQWRSLKTPLLEIAKCKLRELTGEAAKNIGKSRRSGKVTFGVAAASFVEDMRTSGQGLPGQKKKPKRIKQSSMAYREETVKALLASWPELAETDVRKITKEQCKAWGGAYSGEVSPTRFNNTLDSLRHIIKTSGVRVDDPTSEVARMTVTAKKPEVPNNEDLLRLVGEIRKAGGRFSADCADLVLFLATTGCRKGEAARLQWADVNFQTRKIHVKESKNDKPRLIPMNSNSEELLLRMHAERESEAVLRVHEAQKSLDRAAKILGISRITHHDLRDVFATTCLQRGVDIPTVAKWLGHSDGGALLLERYSHVQDAHSDAMAAKVVF